ncbi:MAG: tRNA dihydrouridine synthase DusB [Desulfomonile tiedjei]|nr:tRNA dihydrouridine synthase DusB [Desulfomonile tiedjei]
MRIGNLELQGNVFLAPMAGITDSPFRRVVQGFGVSALWTEMISADGILRSPQAFATTELSGHLVPTIFQIYGTNPAVMAEAALRVVNRGAAAVDVNMGCPARNIVHKGAGAALMKDLPLAARIVATIRSATERPLTVKIRSGWDEQTQNAATFAQAMESEGADAIVVHSRSRSRRHSGPASMEVLQQVKDSVHIPVIGNGGIQEVHDAADMVERTGCDGVMVGRGALGRPWLPGRILKRLAAGAPAEEEKIPVVDVVRLHFRLQLESLERKRAVYRMRKHLGWYSKGLASGTEFRRLVFRELDPDRVLDLVTTWFADYVA